MRNENARIQPKENTATTDVDAAEKLFTQGGDNLSENTSASSENKTEPLVDITEEKTREVQMDSVVNNNATEFNPLSSDPVETGDKTAEELETESTVDPENPLSS